MILRGPAKYRLPYILRSYFHSVNTNIVSLASCARPSWLLLDPGKAKGESRRRDIPRLGDNGPRILLSHPAVKRLQAQIKVEGGVISIPDKIIFLSPYRGSR